MIRKKKNSQAKKSRQLFFWIDDKDLQKSIKDLAKR